MDGRPTGQVVGLTGDDTAVEQVDGEAPAGGEVAAEEGAEDVELIAAGGVGAEPTPSPARKLPWSAMRHQVREIQAANLQPDEEETTQARHTLAANSERLIELSTGVAAELSESEPSLLLVFDEIDADVGGEIAHAVGAKMCSLGRNHHALSGWLPLPEKKPFTP